MTNHDYRKWLHHGDDHPAINFVWMMSICVVAMMITLQGIIAITMWAITILPVN